MPDPDPQAAPPLTWRHYNDPEPARDPVPYPNVRGSIASRIVALGSAGLNVGQISRQLPDVSEADIRACLDRAQYERDMGWAKEEKGSAPLTLRVVRLDPDAVLPTKYFPNDAAFDLSAIFDQLIDPGQTAKVDTGLAMAIPAGWCGVIKGRSGNASKGIDVFGGCIDHGYTGRILAILHNSGTSPFMILAGDRVAQMLLVQVPRVEIVECESLDGTMRGAGGFGHSGR
jgi:dUTP pyrophosphatase